VRQLLLCIKRVNRHEKRFNGFRKAEEEEEGGGEEVNENGKVCVYNYWFLLLY
jgi:hypothetical protein